MSIHPVPTIWRMLAKRGRILPFGFALLVAAACESGPPPMLAENNVLLVADDALWAEIQDTVVSALQPRLAGLPREITYRISHEPPATVSERDLSRFRQVVVLGRPDDAVASEVLRSPGEMPEQLPALSQRADVWAPGQRVTVVALPESGEAEAVLEHLETIAELLDRDFREQTTRRMYASGVDSAITRELASEGIALRVPDAYRRVLGNDSVHRFTTSGNDQDRLVRSLLVTWSPMDEEPPTPESVLDRRQSVADRYYEDAQETQSGSVQIRRIDSGAGGLQVRGVWRGTMYGQLQAGPFVSRMVDCADQNRRYFLDAWLFAPSRAKYPYLVQMEAILDSFGCSAG